MKFCSTRSCTSCPSYNGAAKPVLEVPFEPLVLNVKPITFCPPSVTLVYWLRVCTFSTSPATGVVPPITAYVILVLATNPVITTVVGSPPYNEPVDPSSAVNVLPTWTPVVEDTLTVATHGLPLVPAPLIELIVPVSAMTGVIEILKQEYTPRPELLAEYKLLYSALPPATALPLYVNVLKAVFVVPVTYAVISLPAVELSEEPLAVPVAVLLIIILLPSYVAIAVVPNGMNGPVITEPRNTYLVALPPLTPGSVI